MSKQLTIDDARQSLTAHVGAKGQEIRAKYGPRIGWAQLQQILEDRSCVRYPCEIKFDSGPLVDGEIAWPAPKSEQPDDGFTMHVHPCFAIQPDRVPYIVLYQLVLVNYGDFASPSDAETFGAAVLGITTDEFYEVLCELADQLTGAAPEPLHDGCSSHQPCQCGGEPPVS